MGIKTILKNILSVEDYGNTHHILRLLGVKIKFPKSEFAKKKKESLYYYYKKNNMDITTLPPATGQIRDIQLANLALLKELDYVCKENGLTYWLDGGTMIGAVRHKGFIPWDDDIDVGMMREDYSKIIKAFEKSSRNPDIYAGYSRGKISNCNCIVKVQHKKCPYLFVDIFPFDYYGEKQPTDVQLDNSLDMKRYRKELEKICTQKMSDEVVLEKINKIMTERVLVNEIPEDKTKSELVWGLEFGHYWRNWFTNYDVIFPIKTIEFEGNIFPCINNPDAFLSRVYGDYMSYPKKITMGHSMFLELNSEDKKTIRNLRRSLYEN
jgi:lipopolysaccharide cholinephosphotransferase